VLTPEAMLGELRHRFSLLIGGAQDLPARHQSLRAALDWSLVRLPDDEKALFRRLSVFVGGFNVEAAAVVSGDGTVREADLFRGLESLIDKSLLLPDPVAESGPRFRMLETIRDYAVEILEGSGEQAVIRGRHLTWCADFAERAGRHMGGPEERLWLDRLEADYANMRAAQGWSQTGGDADAGLRMTAWVGHFWWVRGQDAEGLRWLRAALARSGPQPTAVRALAAGTASSLAMRNEDFASARALTEESLAIRRALGDRRGVATALMGLGWIAENLADRQEARRFFEESLALWKDLGHQRGVANALDGLGVVAQSQHDLAAARVSFEESLVFFHGTSNRRGVAIALSRLGTLAATQGDWASARARFEESLTILREFGDTRNRTRVLRELGRTLLAQGDPAAARSCHQECLAIVRERADTIGMIRALNDLGEVAVEAGDLASARALFEESLAIARTRDRRATSLSLNNLGMLAIRQGDHASAHAFLAEGLQNARDVHDEVDTASMVESLGGLAIGRRQPERAARLLAAAEVLRAAIGVALPPAQIRSHALWLAATRAALGPRAFDTAWAQGKATPEAVIGDCLAAPDAPSAVERSTVPLTMRLLGEFEVCRGDVLLAPRAWARRRDRLLLAYLLIAGQPVSRDALLDALWPNLAPAQAGASLRVAWSRLKRALEPSLGPGQPSSYLAAEGGRLGLRWAAITTDVLEFERVILRAGHAPDLNQRVSLLESAVALYRGDLLLADANEPWTVVERERLRSNYLAALRRLAEAKETLRRPEEAVDIVRAILRLEPWQEEAYRWLMRLLVRLGRRSEAVHLYRQCEALLQRELNVAPAPETTALFEAITANRSI